MKLNFWSTNKQASNVLAEIQLQAARVSLLQVQEKAEYYEGMVGVLQKQIHRLEKRRHELPYNGEE